MSLPFLNTGPGYDEELRPFVRLKAHEGGAYEGQVGLAGVHVYVAEPAAGVGVVHRMKATTVTH